MIALLYDKLQNISNKIEIVIDGIFKAEEYIDKLEEELSLLNSQRKMLEQNSLILKSKNTITMIDEYIKLKKSIKQNTDRLLVIQKELNAIKSAVEKQRKLLDMLYNEKNAVLSQIEKQKNNVIKIEDYVKRFKN